jgi:hypothetical protein
MTNLLLGKPRKKPLIQAPNRESCISDLESFFSVLTVNSLEFFAKAFCEKASLPHSSSHSRSRQVKQAQNKYNSGKCTLVAVRVRSGTLYDGVWDPHALHYAHDERVT